MAHPCADAPNFTARSSDTAVWVRDDSPSSSALMDKALHGLPSPHQALIAQVYFDDKDGSIALAIRSGDPLVARLIAAEFELGLRQAGVPGHGGIYVRAGVISDGMALAMLEATVWGQPHVHILLS